jgi:hypothetical protein
MSIEAMKQALEALDIAQAMLFDLKSYHQPKMLQAYTTLRQAIEQAQKQEPVAYVGKSQFERLMGCGLVTTSLTVHKAFPDDIALHASPLQSQPEQEPDDLHIAYMSGLHRGKELSQRQPLTDEQIRQVMQSLGWTGEAPSDIEFARAIEAAHGIVSDDTICIKGEA